MRNMISANKRVFSFLLSRIREAPIAVEELNQVRYIKTDDADKDWLRTLSIDESLSVLPKLKTAVFTFDVKKYFVIIGWYDAENSEDLFTSVDINAGMATALISDLNIPLRSRVDPLEIVNEILPAYRGKDEYEGHDFETVTNFFDGFHVFEINENAALPGGDIYRLTGSFICQNKEKLPLPFSDGTLSGFEKVFFEGAVKIPYEFILMSLNAVQWKHSFLDLYRCVEQLFFVSALDDFHKKLSTEMSLIDFCVEMEDVTGWRPKEEESLAKLLTDTPEYAMKLLEEVKTASTANAEANIAKWFYKLRNSIVHFRPTLNTVVLDDASWDKLIRACLSIIYYHYDVYDKELNA